MPLKRKETSGAVIAAIIAGLFAVTAAIIAGAFSLENTKLEHDLPVTSTASIPLPSPETKETPILQLTETPVFTSTPITLLKDDFLSNNNDWKLSNFTTPDILYSLQSKILGGKLIYNLSCYSSLYDSRELTNIVPHVNAAEFVLSIDATVTQSLNSVDYIKIQFRKIDASNYYELRINNNGWLSLFLILDGNTELLSQQETQAIRKSIGSKNTIQLKTSAASFAVYINGQEALTGVDGNIKEPGEIDLGVSISRGSSNGAFSTSIEFENLLIEGLH
jgi:hypothetical protein